MNEQNTNKEIQLNDMEILFPDEEKYETEDKEMLIAILKDKDTLIRRLWFELKATREQEQLRKDCASEN